MKNMSEADLIAECLRLGRLNDDMLGALGETRDLLLLVLSKDKREAFPQWFEVCLRANAAIIKAEGSKR